MVCALSNEPSPQRAFLKHLFDVGVYQCQPKTVLPPLLPTDAPRGKNIVLGAGKAAAEMAAVANDRLAGETTGLVVTRHGHGALTPTGDIEVVEAGHPVPDANSVEAATKMLAIAETASRDDRVLFLMSGGGSALLCAPIESVSVQQKQELTQFLLRSGARIDEINCVRKKLSMVKGGGLASRIDGAEMLTYIISDVVGDDPSDVASGPSIGSSCSIEEASEVLQQYNYPFCSEVVQAMRAAPRQTTPAHPVHIAAGAQTAIDAIAEESKANGWTPIIVGVDLEGEASVIGRTHAELALRYQKKGERVALISGGELTVRVSNAEGRGGPNLEYLASLMIHLDGAEGIEALACDSDGIDGSEDNAGGYVSPTSLSRAVASGINAMDALGSNDTYGLFANLRDLVITGPTRTNVNDIRIILVMPERV